MRVKIHQNIVSVHGTFHPGQVVNLPDEVAKVWLKKGELVSQVVSKGKPDIIPKGMYWCTHCEMLHREDKKKGLSHLKYRE